MNKFKAKILNHRNNYAISPCGFIRPFSMPLLFCVLGKHAFLSQDVEKLVVYAQRLINYPDFVICDDCYAELPRLSYCWKCNESFESRRKLFKHLNKNPKHKYCQNDCNKD